MDYRDDDKGMPRSEGEKDGNKSLEGPNIREDLMKDLLRRPFVRSHIKQYGITRKELVYLKINDDIRRCEYVYYITIYKRNSKQNGYRNWRSRCLKYYKKTNITFKLHMVELFKRQGMHEEAERILSRYRGDCLPGELVFDDMNSYMEFLSAREQFYAENKHIRYIKKTTIKEEAERLGISERYLKRLLSEGRIQRDDKGKIVNEKDLIFRSVVRHGKIFLAFLNNLRIFKNIELSEEIMEVFKDIVCHLTPLVASMDRDQK